MYDHFANKKNLRIEKGAHLIGISHFADSNHHWLSLLFVSRGRLGWNDVEIKILMTLGISSLFFVCSWRGRESFALEIS